MKCCSCGTSRSRRPAGTSTAAAILSLASFIFHWVAFLLVGVPSPLALALWVAVVSQFVPVIGTYIAGVFPILIALFNEPVTALWVLGLIVVYQQIENYLFAPRITAQTLEIHPAVAFGSVIAGSAVLGPVGALLALPAAATTQAFISSYVQRHSLIESDLLDDMGYLHLEEGAGDDEQSSTDRDGDGDR